MAYISLALAKTHLRVDESYTGEDEYIQKLISAAEDAVSREICEDLKDLENEDGSLPDSLVYAILLKLGDMYANRELTAFGSEPRAIKSLDRLTFLHRNYEG